MKKGPINTLPEQILAQGGQLSKETLDQIFGLARIEVLDGIKQDFIKWITAVGFVITILGLIGANAAIQHAVEDRVRTTLDSFRGEIQKAQVDTQIARREIELVQATVSEKTKELVTLETALKDEIAKGNDLSAVLQRGLKEYFQIRSLAAIYHVSFDGGLSTALSTTLGGVRFPGQGQASPDIASMPNIYDFSRSTPFCAAPRPNQNRSLSMAISAVISAAL